MSKSSSTAKGATARDHEEQIFETGAGIDIQAMYRPDDLGDFDYVRDLGEPGELRIGISNGLWKARKARISPGWAADACLDGLELAPGPLPCPDSARPDGSPRARWALISGLTLSSPPSSPHAGAAPPAAGARLRSPW